MDNQRTLLFGREQRCLASNVGQFRQAFTLLSLPTQFALLTELTLLILLTLLTLLAPLTHFISPTHSPLLFTQLLSYLIVLIPLTLLT